MKSQPTRNHRNFLTALCLVLLLTSPIQAKEASPAPRLVILGLDGVTFDVLNPLIEAGRLPNIAKLVQTGASSVLLSEKPMRSPALWTTVATGQPRDVHGIYDFVTGSRYWPKEARHRKQELVTSDMLKSPPLWAMASAAGLPSLVVGWLNTWPAQPIKGVMVAPYVALGQSKQTSIKGKIYKNEQGQTFPEATFNALKDQVLSASDVPTSRIAQIADLPHQKSSLYRKIPKLKRYTYTIRWSIASTLTNTAIVETLLENQPDTRLVMSYFDGSDTLAHRFWLMRQPLPEIKARLKGHKLPPSTAKELKRRFGGVIDGYYELLDEMVGRIHAAAGPQSTLILLSDHGWGKQDRKRAIHSGVPFDGQHELEGVFIAHGPMIRAGKFKDLTLYDVAPTALYLMGQGVPEELPGKIALDMVQESFKLQNPPITLANNALKTTPEKKEAKKTKAPHAETEIERLKSLGYIQ
ncbi:MAG: alkaline phosphatase family protein [Myxococcota bacterium]|nr:alkaline phosphatase family protein [Myxococcota bacterium]